MKMNNTMRVALWVVGVVFVVAILIAVFLHWLRTDQALSIEAKNLIQHDLLYQPSLKVAPYFDLLGIDTKDNLNPQVLGRWRYHREWANYIGESTATEQVDMPNALNQHLVREHFSEKNTALLEQVKTALNHQPTEFKILVRQHAAVLQALINQEHIPLKRLNDLWLRTDYVSLPQAPIAASPDYKYLYQLQILTLAKIELNSADKLHDYKVLFDHALHFTQNRLSVIEKMLTQKLLNQLIEQMREEQLSTSKSLMLPTLNTEQLSIQSSLQNEATTQYLVLRYLSLSYRGAENSGKWTTYLPNMTFNELAERDSIYSELSRVPYHQLKQKMGELQPKENGGWQVKNFVGHTLAQIGGPEFKKYLLMNHILNNKIFAFNALNTGELDIVQLNRNAEGRRYFEKQGKLCVEIPYPENEIAALNLKIDSCVKI